MLPELEVRVRYWLDKCPTIFSFVWPWFFFLAVVSSGKPCSAVAMGGHRKSHYGPGILPVSSLEASWHAYANHCVNGLWCCWYEQSLSPRPLVTVLSPTSHSLELYAHTALQLIHDLGFCRCFAIEPRHRMALFVEFSSPFNECWMAHAPPFCRRLAMCLWEMSLHKASDIRCALMWWKSPLEQTASASSSYIENTCWNIAHVLASGHASSFSFEIRTSWPNQYTLARSIWLFVQKMACGCLLFLALVYLVFIPLCIFVHFLILHMSNYAYQWWNLNVKNVAAWTFSVLNLSIKISASVGFIVWNRATQR